MNSSDCGDVLPKSRLKGAIKATMLCMRTARQAKQTWRDTHNTSMEASDVSAYENEDIDVYRQFSPMMVHRHIYKYCKSHVSSDFRPFHSTHYGALLFADVSGFTMLANILSVESLQYHMSNFFRTLFDGVEKFGGDILKICGDAIIIMWPLDYPAEHINDNRLLSPALMACLCGQYLLKYCGSYETMENDISVSLSLHCAVGVGDIQCYWVGKYNRWEFLVAGDPVMQVASAERDAGKGQIVVSPAVYALIKSHIRASKTKSNNYLLHWEPKKNQLHNHLETLAPDDYKEEFFSKRRFSIKFKLDRSRDDDNEESSLDSRKSRRNKRDILQYFLSRSRSASMSSSDFDWPSTSMDSCDDVPSTPPPRPPAAARHSVTVTTTHSPSLLGSTTMRQPRSSTFDMTLPLDAISNVTPNSDLPSPRSPRRAQDPAVVAFFEKHHEIATSLLYPFSSSHPFRASMMNAQTQMSVYMKYFVHESARPATRASVKFKTIVPNKEPLQVLGEIREIVTLFVRILHVEEAFNNGDIDGVQQIMEILLDSHICFGGALRQFVMDDKGCIAIGALGVHRYTYDDNDVRAIEIAKSIRLKLNRLGISCAIGISRGKAYCGFVGMYARSEYAMLGGSVNLAARLMCACPKNEITVDGAVQASLSEQFRFVSRGTIIAKGYAEPVRIYAYCRPRLGLSRALSTVPMPAPTTHQVGLSAEIDGFKLYLHDFCEGVEGCTRQFHYVEGEDGTGKTFLLERIIEVATSYGAQSISLTCSDIYSRTSYWAIARLIERMLISNWHGVDENDCVSSMTTAALEQWVVAKLDRNDVLIHGQLPSSLVSLLSMLLYQDCDAESIDVAMCDQLKEPETIKVLISFILTIFATCLRRTDTRRVVLIIDNISFCDEVSLNIIGAFIESTSACMCVFASRPVAPTASIYNSIVTFKQAVLIHNLLPFDAHKTKLLIESILDVSLSSDHAVVDRVYRLSDGKPGIIKYLTDIIKNDDKNLTYPLEKLRTPAQDSIIKKFDMLDAQEKIILKVASVIGPFFSLNILTYILRTTRLHCFTPDVVERTPRTRSGSSSVNTSPPSTPERRDSKPTTLPTIVIEEVADINKEELLRGLVGLITDDFIGDLEKRQNREDVDLLPSSCQQCCGSMRASNCMDDWEIMNLIKRRYPEVLNYGRLWIDAVGNYRFSGSSCETGVCSRESQEAILKKSYTLSIFANEEPGHTASFYFLNSSIQSTVYALTLDEDREAIHYAIVKYLQAAFGTNTLGTEDTIIYHALCTPHSDLKYSWLLRGAEIAKMTGQHSLFIHRILQLVHMMCIIVCPVEIYGFDMIENHYKKKLNKWKRNKLFPTAFLLNINPYDPDHSLNCHADNTHMLLATHACWFSDLSKALLRAGDYVFAHNFERLSREILNVCFPMEIKSSTPSLEYFSISSIFIKSEKDKFLVKNRYHHFVKEATSWADKMDADIDANELISFDNDVPAIYEAMFCNHHVCISVLILGGQLHNAMAKISACLEIIFQKMTNVRFMMLLFAKTFAYESTCLGGLGADYNGEAKTSYDLACRMLQLHQKYMGKEQISPRSVVGLPSAKISLQSIAEAEWLVPYCGCLRAVWEGRWEVVSQKSALALSAALKANIMLLKRQVTVVDLWAAFLSGNLTTFQSAMMGHCRSLQQIPDSYIEHMTLQILGIRYAFTGSSDIVNVLMGKKNCNKVHDKTILLFSQAKNDLLAYSDAAINEALELLATYQDMKYFVWFTEAFLYFSGYYAIKLLAACKESNTSNSLTRDLQASIQKHLDLFSINILHCTYLADFYQSLRLQFSALTNMQNVGLENIISHLQNYFHQPQCPLGHAFMIYQAVACYQQTTMTDAKFAYFGTTEFMTHVKQACAVLALYEAKSEQFALYQYYLSSHHGRCSSLTSSCDGSLESFMDDEVVYNNSKDNARACWLEISTVFLL